MKSKYLLSVVSLLIFISSCKKSNNLDENGPELNKAKATFSFTPLLKPQSTSRIAEEVTFLVTVSGGKECWVSLFSPGGSLIVGDVHFDHLKTTHTFTLLEGTNFYVHTTSPSGATYDSEVKVAGLIGGVIINVPD